MKVYCGIDWAEKHHDIALVDEAGTVIAQQRIAESPQGYEELLTILAEAGDTAEIPIPVAIETLRGLLVSQLRATGRRVFAINPLSASRYRDRHSVSRKKSYRQDAVVLANILRTDMALHRPLPADSHQAQAIAVLARGHQDAVWRVHRIGNELRSLLREYHPAFLTLFAGQEGGITCREARAVLKIAPTLATARQRTMPNCEPRSRTAAASIIYRPGPNACTPASKAPICANQPRSKRQWAGKRWRYWPFSMPPAKPQPTCTRPPSLPSVTTPTTTSSPASLAWAS